MSTLVTFYTRKGCHLCDEAEVELQALAAELPIEVEAVDIDVDSTMRMQFNDIVPVISVGGSVVTGAPINFKLVRCLVMAKMSVS